MFSRRDFIGSVIGTLISLKLPFIAETPRIRQLSDFDRELLTKRLWDCPLEYLEHFKGFYVSPLGDIKGTPLLSVSRTENNIQFKYDNLVANQHLVFSHIGLITPGYYELCRSHLNEPWFRADVNLLPGDTLMGTFNISRTNY